LKTISIALFSIALLMGCQQEADTTEAPAPEPRPVNAEVRTASGPVLGLVAEDGLKQFHGIPFAEPPIGDLRWSPPVPALPWTAVRDASKAGPACMQPQGQGGSFYGASGFEMDEDCLTLNVWTRASDETDALPVMVWIHGGALVTGSGDRYPGELLTSKGVVLVSVNYRLGRFGFHAHPELSAENASGVSGNQGLRDQILALEWVQENIASFGGDPGNVTIFGESAGSLSMSLVQASPLAAGLFHRVIGESGGAFQPMWYRDRETGYAASAYSVGTQFVEALAGEGGDSTLASLRQLPQEHLLEVFQSDPAFSNYDSLAIVDGEVIPEEVATIFAEGRQADVPVLIGSNADEGSTFLEFFTPMFGEGQAGLQAYLSATLPEVTEAALEVYAPSDSVTAEKVWSDAFSDVLFAYPMRVWARGMENVDSDAYLYWFTWVPPVENSEQYGAFHAAEIGYVFGNVELFGATPTSEDYAFSDLMATIWTQFAKTGNPNGEGLPNWPAYSSDTESYMELGVNTGSKAELRIRQMDLIGEAWAKRRSQEGEAAIQLAD
jgi:para-nitrobenzyl esterase